MDTDVPTWVSVVLMAVGVTAVVRTAFVVASNEPGLFRGDLLISLVGGFSLLYLGQYLLE